MDWAADLAYSQTRHYSQWSDSEDYFGGSPSDRVNTSKTWTIKLHLCLLFCANGALPTIWTFTLFYLACFHLSLLLAAVSAVRLELSEAELSEQVAGAAQQVARKAQVPARL